MLAGQLAAASGAVAGHADSAAATSTLFACFGRFHEITVEENHSVMLFVVCTNCVYHFGNEMNFRISDIIVAKAIIIPAID